MNFAQAIVQVITELAPAFIVVAFVFIVFSWIRVLLDKMSGTGM